MSRKSKKDRTEHEMSHTTLRMLLDYYVGDMRLKNRTTDAIKSNQGTLERFGRHLGGAEIRLAQITEEKVTAYIEWLQSRQTKWENHPNRPAVNQPLSPYTIRKTVKVLRGFGNWLAREGFPNPFDVLEIPSVPKDLVETLKPDEVHRLLNSLNLTTPHGARDYAVLLLMLDSGLRISEVAELKMPTLDLAARQAIICGKGRKERYIPFGQTTARALMRYISAFRPKPTRHDTENVLLTLDGQPLTRGSLESIIRRLRLSTGITRLHAHLLRHTFAVNYLAAGGDVESLRRILGHESLEVTKRYLSGLQASQVQALYEDYSPVDRLELTDTGRRFGRRGITRKPAPNASPAEQKSKPNGRPRKPPSALPDKIRHKTSR
jgi:site-specific recombinase XerD